MRWSRVVLVALLLLAGAGAGCGFAPTRQQTARAGAADSPGVPVGAFAVSVLRVVDGDTLVARVTGRGRSVRVRLIGVDTPESVRPGAPVACFAAAAAALTRRLLRSPPARGPPVRAAYQPGPRTDRYDRELWDVWLPDGRLLQAVLVASGAARDYPYAPALRYAGLLHRLAEDARRNGRGLWGPPCRGDSFERPGPG